MQALPPAAPQQARIIWMAITAFAVTVFLGILGLACWGLAWVVAKLSGVLLPLVVAGILAYLLDPLVTILEGYRIPRRRAIFLVFFTAIALSLLLVATILPLMFEEARQLIDHLPAYSTRLAERSQEALKNWMAHSPLAAHLKTGWVTDVKDWLQKTLSDTAPVISAWFLTQISRVASWFGFLVGLALAPVYLFYLLLEKEGIRQNWTDYLPFRESRAKQEFIFIFESINNYLIVFFRGQVLVAMCDGALLTIGFLALGMDYAFLLGIGAGFLGIVPFVGVIISLVPAVILAVIQFGDWLHPVLVASLFGFVQFLEGFVISPKIIGDRVGLHPLTIMISVMVGTTLLGGIAGGILAIPLTAALRVLMGRYVWKRNPIVM